MIELIIHYFKFVFVQLHVVHTCPANEIGEILLQETFCSQIYYFPNELGVISGLFSKGGCESFQLVIYVQNEEYWCQNSA